MQTLPGLTDQQKGVCTKVPETVESVPFGTRQGLVECEYQFRNELWNCSDNRDSRRIQQTIDRGEHRLDGSLLWTFNISLSGSKETAFLYAVTSAGVVHTIAKACASGEI